MKATLTAVIAAIEAAAIALAVFVAVGIPGVLVWWLALDLAGDPSQAVAGIGGVWLLAHLVPLTFSLTPDSALALGLEPQALSFVISLAPLTLSFLTALLAFRSGWRLGNRGGSGVAAPLGGAAGFAAAAGVVALIATPVVAAPVWVAILVPALWFGAWSTCGFVARTAASGHDWWRSAVRQLQRRLQPLSPLGAAVLPTRAREVVRQAAASFAALLGLGALGLAGAIVVGYVEIVTLSQGLQLDLLANLLVFLAQLAVLPVAWAWAVAWCTGAGFAIGTGTSVTPFDTLLGPLPSLPLLGAIPQAWGNAGALAPALVVLAGVLVGALAGGSREFRRVPLLSAILVPVFAAAFTGLAVVGFSALASGAIGPGRLSEVGPAPWLVGGLAAAELGAGILCGVLARRIDHARLLERVPRLRLGEREKPTEAADTLPLTPLVVTPVEEPAVSQAPTSALTPAPATEISAVPIPPSDESDEESLMREYAWENGAQRIDSATPSARTSRWRRWLPKG
ncbi:cell division protein PerM [Leucobacter sp. W1038]|uniref:cell division protein PerM n=1 Tax=Leucobacter sp. W1038 TaxID=3438281 RepID=UPI003D966BC5